MTSKLSEYDMNRNTRTVALGSDHAGYELKKAISDWLKGNGWDVRDVGAPSAERADYPIYGKAAAEMVQSGECRLGVLICGTGVGIALAANKMRGIRCAVCSEPFTAKLARQHNDANMLGLGARVVGPGLALMIVEEFLNADFEGGRHKIRVDMITQIEEENRNGTPPSSGARRSAAD
jgi:ribose 5-phosphate isomerase B